MNPIPGTRSVWRILFGLDPVDRERVRFPSYWNETGAFKSPDGAVLGAAYKIGPDRYRAYLQCFDTGLILVTEHHTSLTQAQRAVEDEWTKRIERCGFAEVDS